MRHIRFALGLATLVGNAGLCEAQGVPLRTIRHVPCSTCSLTIRDGPVLSLPSDSLSFATFFDAMYSADGHYLVAPVHEVPRVAVFGPRGDFLRFLGRTGQGPGEFTAPQLVLPAAGDSLWVMDRGRRHIYDANLRFVRSEVAAATGRDMLVLPTGQVVAAALVQSPDRAGFPLHLSDGRSSQIVRSFGTRDTNIDPRELARTSDNLQNFLRRELVPGGDSTFWVYNPTRFLLEQYSFRGDLLSQARRELEGWYAAATAARPSPGAFNGKSLATVIPSDDPNILWLIYTVFNDRYSPERVPRTLDVVPISRMHDVIIEALDTRTFSVIAQGRVRGTIPHRVRNLRDAFAVVHPRGDLFYGLRIVELRLADTQ